MFLGTTRRELESAGTPGAAETLLRREAEFRASVEGANDVATFLLDAAGRVATWNPGAERFTGHTTEEILDAPVACLYTSEDREDGKPQRDLEAVMQRGRIEEEQLRVRKNGARFWASVVTTALHGEDGQLLGFGCHTRDISERRRAEERFRWALEAAPTGMIMIDRTGRIVLVNAQVERLFGYDRRELIGQTVELLVPVRFRDRHPAFRTGFSTAPRSRPMGAGRDLFGLRKDGAEIPIEIGLNPLRTPEGDFVLSSIVDIAERKSAERERHELLGQLRTLNVELEERVRTRTAELTATLRERDVLLQEIHHRVKNNLYVISSLIEMQARRLEGGATRGALEECQTRVQAIALIHEKLYQSRDYSRIPFSDYAASLAADIFAATGSRPDVSLELAIKSDVVLPVSRAIPCGLILNELITNALKHAFPPGRAGNIRVEFGGTETGQHFLAVQDDGVGILDEAAVRRSDSLGLQLVCTLAEQLEATLEVVQGSGTRFQIAFPAGE